MVMPHTNSTAASSDVLGGSAGAMFRQVPEDLIAADDLFSPAAWTYASTSSALATGCSVDVPELEYIG